MIDKKARAEAKQEVKMYQSNDWDLAEETPEFFTLKRNNSTMGGHVLVFILTFWFTFGIGNVVYYFLQNKTKKIIK